MLLPSSLTLPHCHVGKGNGNKAPWRGVAPAALGLAVGSSGRNVGDLGEKGRVMVSDSLCQSWLFLPLLVLLRGKGKTVRAQGETWLCRSTAERRISLCGIKRL